MAVPPVLSHIAAGVPIGQARRSRRHTRASRPTVAALAARTSERGWRVFQGFFCIAATAYGQVPVRHAADAICNFRALAKAICWRT